MNVSENHFDMLACDFCKKRRIQVGVLTCQHRMCADCYPHYRSRLDRCSICILMAAEVKREAMKIVPETIQLDLLDESQKKQSIFCSNRLCPLIRTPKESMDRHWEVCGLVERRLTRPSPTSASHSVAEFEDIAPPSEEIRHAIASIMENSHKKQDGLGSRNLEHSCPTSDYSSKPSDSDKPSLPPKFSVEISEYVDLSHDIDVRNGDAPHGTTPQTVTSADDSSSPIGAQGWDFCGDSTDRRNPSKRAVNESKQDPKPNPDQPRNGSVQAGSEQSRGGVASPEESYGAALRLELACLYSRVVRFSNRAVMNITWYNASVVLVWLIAVTYSLSFERNEVPLVQATPNYVTWEMNRLSDLMARAQFNKRDMQLSEAFDVGDYKARLGVGSTFSVADSVAVIWVTAVIIKSNDLPWPPNERMQLRLENKNPDLAQTYDFTPQQRGNWRENMRVQRGQLIYRQLQVDTTDRLKYLRFSYYMTYDDGATKGYIEDDTIVVGLKIVKDKLLQV